MIGWLVLLFVAVPLVELAAITEVAGRIGGTNALLLIIVFSAAGAGLIKYQGLATIRRVRSGLQDGRMPTSKVIDGLGLLVAGILLFVPGFVTSAVGLLLLLPPVRAWARAAIGASISRRVALRVRAAGFGTVPPGGAPRGGRPSSSSWQPGWSTPGGGPGGRAGPTTGPRTGFRRPYRRPDEPDPMDAKLWGARVRDPQAGDADVIDIDGEEVVFDVNPELGPSGQ